MEKIDVSGLPTPNSALIRKDDTVLYLISWNAAGLWDLYEIDQAAIVAGDSNDITYRSIHFMDYTSNRISSILKVDMVAESGNTDARLGDEHPMTMAAIVKDMMEKWFAVSMPIAPNITQNYIDTGSTTKH